jgi:hypothetical protein
LNTANTDKKNIQDIKDFPVIKLKRITNKILFGSFQLRQAKIYVNDVLNNDTIVYIYNETGLKMLKKYKNVFKNVLKKKTKLCVLKFYQDISEVQIKCFTESILNTFQIITP